MKIYLKILSAFYLIGGGLHLLDLFDLRLKFSEMNSIWKMWILYLLIFDILAAIGLWRTKTWGANLFLMVAGSQLIAYVGFMNFFGPQYILIVFHLITIAFYIWLNRKKPTLI